MRPGLLSDIVTIGYEILLEGDHVKLRYRKQDNPPDTVRPLIDELRKCKADVMKILKMGNNSCTSTEKLQPRVDVTSSWPGDYQSIIDWFMTLEPPLEPFNLEPHLRVIDPVKFFGSLRREIETGPEGARARMGTLQSDLRKLKAYLN